MIKSETMNIVFGMYLDGTEWNQQQASLGELQLGPAGLLSLLETQLGLTGIVAHPAQRINEYMQWLEQADSSDAWFHESLQQDAWSTSKQMLAWRDELIGAGWNGLASKAVSPRLHALANVEATDLPLALGREDRLQAVLSALKAEGGGSIAIATIYSQEPFELLPPVWNKLFARLKSSGVCVKHAFCESNTIASSNLSQVRAAFVNADHPAAMNAEDHSLILLKAADEWEAAEHIATWLAADTANNDQVTIICDSSSDILDQALVRQGLPKLGSAVNSQWRAVLQVLPLVLVNAWKPVDIHRLVELLALPVSPVPRFAARHLLEAVSSEPGIGGDAWRSALNNITTERAKIAEKESKTWVDHEAFVQELDEMLALNRFDPEEGIKEANLNQRCQWVIEWLAKQVEYNPILIEAMSHAREMQKLAMGKGYLSRVTVERMLDSVIATGSTAPDRFQQAAPWSVVSHPKQITTKRGTIIWWGFYDQGQSPAVYWSHTERSYLESQGAELETTATYRLREADAWQQSIRQADDALIFVTPERMHGDAVFHHPFWDEVRNAAAKSDDEDEVTSCLIRCCDELQQKGNKQKGKKQAGQWQLAGRSMPLSMVEPFIQSVAQGDADIASDAVHNIPVQAVHAPKHLSYSQMSSMIACPMKWALHYHAHLRVPAPMAVPTGNQMIGSFTHRIIEALYAEPVKQWDADDAAAKAVELYDQFLPSMASELMLDGHELDNQRYREAVAQAVRLLVEAIDQGGLTVIRAEQKLEGALTVNDTAIPFVGFADLMLRDAKGKLFVLDLKWSGSSNYRKKEIEEGSALQLATYAWLLRDKNRDAWAEGGYFMLAQGELLSDSPLFGLDALTPARSTQEIWKLGVRTWKQRWLELQGGRMKATGVLEGQLKASGLSRDKVQAQMKGGCDVENLLYQSPPCGFCDFATLCGLNEGQS